MQSSLWRNISVLGACIISIAIFFAVSRRTDIIGHWNIRPLDHIVAPARPYLPYPKYNSSPYKQKWRGTFASCKGPDDLYLNQSLAHVAHARPAPREGPLTVVLGDAHVSGIDTKVCFEGSGRLGPYGHPHTGRGNGSDSLQFYVDLDWSAVRWGQLQYDCLRANQDRFYPHARTLEMRPTTKEMPANSTQLDKLDVDFQPTFHPRTALLIRSWVGYNYTENEIRSIRALITELSLLSGGEYQVFLLVEVKEWNSKFWSNQTTYQRVLKNRVPKEFRDITILWNSKVLNEWYPDIGDWQVYWHQFMPLQWFSKTHPEFEYIWNWEVDARCIGNHYHMLEGFAKFAKKQPRKYLWERNARFYIPSAHGTYEEWTKDTHGIIESAMTKGGNVSVAWGPQVYNKSSQQPIGPTPPTTLEEDDFQWGVGEEADLITLLPIWDPTYTRWTYRDKIFNFIPGVRPHFSANNPLDVDFHHPGFVNISRRTYINTVSRFSKQLLHAMHVENLAGRDMVAEMWPGTVALQHGLKAVYAPHPIMAEWQPIPKELDDVFNADGGELGRWSAGPDSVYNQDREWRFKHFSWFFNAEFPRQLYQTWLTDKGLHGNNESRLCLPQMMLHPVKDT